MPSLRRGSRGDGRGKLSRRRLTVRLGLRLRLRLIPTPMRRTRKRASGREKTRRLPSSRQQAAHLLAQQYLPRRYRHTLLSHRWRTHDLRLRRHYPPQYPRRPPSLLLSVTQRQRNRPFRLSHPNPSPQSLRNASPALHCRLLRLLFPLRRRCLRSRRVSGLILRRRRRR